MKINKKILKWSVQQWPLRTHATRKAKLIEELKELIQALENNDEVNTAEELFDAYAMIVDYADANKVRMKNIFKAKRIIIENRKRIGKQKDLERGIIRTFM